MSEDIEEQKKEETIQAEEDNVTNQETSFEDAHKAYHELFFNLKNKEEYSTEDCEKFCAAKGAMLGALSKENPEKLKDSKLLVDLIESPANLGADEIANLPQFDLHSHLSELMDHLVVNEATSALFKNAAQNGQITYKHSQELYGLLNNHKIMSGPEAEKNQAKCRETLEKMITGENSGKIPNKELAELVEKCGGLDKVQFNIMNENGVDGHASFSQKRADKGGNGIIINITKGAFENDYKGLPMLLGHELGHILDFSKRPEGYPASLKDAEEYFTDYMGNQLVNNGNFTEKEKYKAKKAFIADTKKFKDDELCQSRVKIMTDYIKIQHPQQYYGKYLQTLRGMGNALGQPEKQVKGNEQIKEMDILSKLRGKNSRE